jgi:HEPN domain-containing protein
MIEGKHKLVAAWMEKASHDLQSARILATADAPVLDTAIYHCQQAAEKAVKGYLVFHDIRFEKTHDVGDLVLLAAKQCAGFGEWNHAAQWLTPYARIFRYPGEVAEPEADEFREALHLAEGFVAFVLSLLPSEVSMGGSCSH